MLGRGTLVQESPDAYKQAMRAPRDHMDPLIVPASLDHARIEKVRGGDILWEVTVYGRSWDEVDGKARRAIASIEAILKDYRARNGEAPPAK